MVRLYQGDYDKMTVYDPEPLNTVRRFEAAGASCLHLVDLEGAKSGETTNLATIEAIAQKTKLFIEVGGGIRNMETIQRYLDAGANRVILGTAAATDPDFTALAVQTYGEKIAVGADLKNGKIAIHGWLETAQESWDVFLGRMESLGVGTVICTDISKDGVMEGTNHKLYAALSARYDMNIIASGGVTSLEDVKALRKAGASGAIIGKALYTGAIDLVEAVRAGEGKL